MTSLPDAISPALSARLDEYLAFARSLADEAAALAVSQFGSSIARRKSDGTLVTHTDEQIDALITRRLAAAYPGDTVLSEEQATWFDPAVERTWVIDPVDGTTNFARGLLTWGVSVALLVHGRCAVGVVHFPLLNEIFTAAAGRGALCNGEPIHTATDGVDDEHLFMECTRTRRLYTFALPLKSRMMGSAAYHICKVADGSALAGSEATPKIWDIAAAALVLEEAGGVIHTTAREDVFPLDDRRMDYKTHAYPVLYASGETLWQEVFAARRVVARNGGA